MNIQISEKLRNYFTSKGQNESECLLYLFSCKYNLQYRCSEETFQFLVQENFIKLNLMANKVVCLVGLFEGEVVDLPDVDLSIEVEIRQRVDEYRRLFKGVRSGSTGIKEKVIQMLTQFCIENMVTFDEVLEVTKVYMTYTDFQMLSNADNFILKTDKSGEQISLLKLAFEEQGMDSESDNKTWKVI